MVSRVAQIISSGWNQIGVFFFKAPAVVATCRLGRHGARGRRSLDAVACRKATWAASWAAAGGSRLQSRSVKSVHLQMCPAVNENLTQVGDAPGCRATPPAPVKSGYGRQQKVFCQKVITNIATYNVRTLKAKWRQHELVGFLERKRIDVCATQEDELPTKMNGETESTSYRPVHTNWHVHNSFIDIHSFQLLSNSGAVIGRLYVCMYVCSEFLRPFGLTKLQVFLLLQVLRPLFQLSCCLLGGLNPNLI